MTSGVSWLWCQLFKCVIRRISSWQYNSRGRRQGWWMDPPTDDSVDRWQYPLNCEYLNLWIVMSYLDGLLWLWCHLLPGLWCHSLFYYCITLHYRKQWSGCQHYIYKQDHFIHISCTFFKKWMKTKLIQKPLASAKVLKCSIGHKNVMSTNRHFL